MPINYSKYPPNWQDIRLTVLARAGEERDRYGEITREAKCELCGLENHEHGLRCRHCSRWYSAEHFSNEWISDDCHFKEQGYSYIFGPDIGHEGDNPERQDYVQVVLEKRLLAA